MQKLFVIIEVIFEEKVAQWLINLEYYKQKALRGETGISISYIYFKGCNLN